MNRRLDFRILALTCCFLGQGLMVAEGQGQQPSGVAEQTGPAVTTKSGLTDGVWSPAWSPALTGVRRPLYRLCKSDVVAIRFPFSPEFDQTVSVQPDGYIALRGVAQLLAEGVTLPELQSVIRRAYAGVLHDPEVSIVLMDFDKPHFMVLGEVNHPGKYELRSDITVTEALAVAGGLSPRAKHSQIVLFRPVSDELIESRLLNVKSMLKSRNLGEDIHLRPGDFLFVPQNMISKIKPYMPTSSLSVYASPAQFYEEQCGTSGPVPGVARINRIRNDTDLHMPEELRLIPRPARVPSPTLRDLLAVVFRQRRLTLISFVGVFLAVVLYGLVAPSYQSEMKVLVRRGRVDPVVSSTPSQAEFEHEGVTEEELNSEVDLLHDGEILRTVARNSGLIGESQSWFWSLVGDTEERQLARAVRRLNKRLTVEPVRKATLITVSYKCSDPAQAAAVLHSLASAYIERHEQLHRPSGEFKFFDQQVVQSRGSLEEAELELMRFGSDQGVTSAALERDMALQKLSEADADTRQTQVSIAATSERVRALERKLNLLPERITTLIRDSDNPQLMEKMKARLLELQLDRTELLTRYEPSYRPVQEVEKKIAETKAAIAAEAQAPIHERTSDQDPDHEWAKAELLKTQVELTAMTVHATAEKDLLTHYQEAANQLGDRAIEQEQLLHDLKASEEKYLLYLNKREEARIGDALDQGGILNVTIAEQATVPALPELSGLSFGFIGLMCGSTLSVTLAFVSDYLNPAFRTPDEIVAYLDSPVLASLPRKMDRKMRLLDD